MLMMRPKRARRMAPTTARAQRKAPVTFTRSTSSHSSSGIWSNGRISSVEKIAALLIRISMRPNSLSTAFAIAATESGSAMSVVIARELPPVAAISAATASPRSRLRSAMTAMAPCAANALAKARPMPWPAPVMIATRPSSEFVITRSRPPQPKLQARDAPPMAATRP
jgi:hypothetical protein